MFWVSSRRGSERIPTNCVLSRNKKLKYSFTVKTFKLYLNRRVFDMCKNMPATLAKG